MDISVKTLPAQHNIKVSALTNNLKVTGIVIKVIGHGHLIDESKAM